MTKSRFKFTNELLRKWHEKIDECCFKGCSKYMQQNFTDASIRKIIGPLADKQEEYDYRARDRWDIYPPFWTDIVAFADSLPNCCGVAVIRSGSMISTDHIKLACKLARVESFGIAVATFNGDQEHLIPLFRRAGFKTGMGWTTNPVHNSKICLMVKAIDKL